MQVYLHQWTGSPLVQIMTYHLIGAKLIHEPTMTCQLNTKEQTQLKFHIQTVPFNNIHLQINGLVQDCSNSSANALELLQSCTNRYKCCLQNRGHFVPASMCYPIWSCLLKTENRGHSSSCHNRDLGWWPVKTLGSPLLINRLVPQWTVRISFILLNNRAIYGQLHELPP